MPNNKQCDYYIIPKVSKINVVEERILNYKIGPEIIAYKVKIDNKYIWINKDVFDLVFRKEILF